MHVLDFGAITHRGAVRTLNEDSILASAPVFVVADGIGGAEAGEVASAIVVEEFLPLADLAVIESDDVTAALNRAHLRVRALHAESGFGAGTTACGAVGLTFGDMEYWLVFNIGDSRVYRRQGQGSRRLVQVSVDHSHVQELLDAGVITAVEASRHPERNVVTRAVGSEESFEPDYWLLPMVPGERLLLCSDGLLSESPYREVEVLVQGSGSAHTVVDELLELSLRSGARDNVSVIVVDVLERAPDEDHDTTLPMAEIQR
ncbi:MAG: PP2C family protein-serine/threonine phosphatase [Propionibacteriaceae bacterium]